MLATTSTMILEERPDPLSVILKEFSDVVERARADPEFGPVEQCLLQYKILAKLPIGVQLPNTVLDELQRLLIRLSIYKLRDDPMETNGWNENVFYWLWQVQRLTPEVLDRNAKTVQKLVKLVLNGLVWILSRTDPETFERCALIATHFLTLAPQMTSHSQIVLTVNNMFSKRKKSESIQVYFTWIKAPSRVAAAKIAEVLWKIGEFGGGLWRTAETLELFDFVQAIKYSMDLGVPSLEEACKASLVGFFSRASNDVYIHFRDVFYRLSLPSDHPLVLAITPVILKRFAQLEPMEPMFREVLRKFLEEEVDDVYVQILTQFIRNSYYRVDEESLEKVLMKICKDLDRTVTSPHRLRLFNAFFHLKDVRVPVPVTLAIKAILPRYNELKRNPELANELRHLRILCKVALSHRERLGKAAMSESNVALPMQRRMDALQPSLGSVLCATYSSSRPQPEAVEDKLDKVRIEDVESQKSKIDEIVEAFAVNEKKETVEQDEIVIDSDEDEVIVLDDESERVGKTSQKCGKEGPTEAKRAKLQDLVEVNDTLWKPGTSELDSGGPDSDQDWDDDTEVVFCKVPMSMGKARELFQDAFDGMTPEQAYGRMKLTPLEPETCDEGAVNIMSNLPDKETRDRIKQVMDPARSEKAFLDVMSGLGVSVRDMNMNEKEELVEVTDELMSRAEQVADELLALYLKEVEQQDAMQT